MKIGVLILVLLIIGCEGVHHEPGIVLGNRKYMPKGVKKVSFDNLIKIRNLNGEFIEIEGVFRHNFEDVAVYASRRRSDFGNSLWLNFTFTDNLLEKLNGKWVVVVGKVNLGSKGHLGGYYATLDSVYYIRGY